MFPRSTQKVIFGIAVLLVISLGCSLLQTNPTPIPPTETIIPSATSSDVINGPEGTMLKLDNNALTDSSQIQMAALGSGEFDWSSTPFQAASQEYEVSFGTAQQVGGITLTVPLTSPGSAAMYSILPDSSGAAYAYAAWVLPDTGSPSLVGAIVDQGSATFPLVGAGKYQVLQILSAAGIAQQAVIFTPLSVPTYPQMTSSWCSPTALTDAAGYHAGAWAGGELGSVWGESSNWYLAGKAGQPYNTGYFFHWLLAAGGYSVPESVRESFTNGNAEVFIWNWYSAQIDPFVLEMFDVFPTFEDYYIAEQEQYATELFNFFHSYVESNLWGLNGDRRPVAWGSSLAGHSRVITGSDGTNIYYNNPSSGSWNSTYGWEQYHQDIIDSLDAPKVEVIDTVVFHAPPRPANQRHAVLWLLQKSDSQEGSIILRRGENAQAEAYWLWDGALSHSYGYYYQDLMGELPPNDAFDVEFKAFTRFDKVEYSYWIQSISEGSHEYTVHTELFTSRGGKVDVDLPDQTATVDEGGRAAFYPAGSFPIVDLTPFLYYLKFTLSEGGVVQDVKYVYFWIAENNVPHIPMAVTKYPAYCRKGPGVNFEVSTLLEAGQEMRLLALNPTMDWGKFEVTLGGNTVKCWVGLSMVDRKDDLNVPIEVVTPVPVPGVSCGDYTTVEACGKHSECTWKYSSFGPGFCTNK